MTGCISSPALSWTLFTLCLGEQASSETKKKQRKERKAQHRAQAQNKGQDDKKGELYSHTHCQCRHLSHHAEKENKPPLDAEKANLEAQRSEFVAKDLLQVSCVQACILDLSPPPDPRQTHYL